MSDPPPDFGALARLYLDLWQEQVNAMTTDPAVADAADWALDRLIGALPAP